MGRKRRRSASRRRRSWPRGLGIVVGALALGLIGGGAWAYQEVTRQPPPVPADDMQIPPPETEPLSRHFPRHTAVYGRLSLKGPASALIRNGLSGFGLGTLLEGIPVSRYILPGLNAMMGYPLFFDGEGELVLEHQAALESDETRRLLGEILSEAKGDAVLGLYAADQGAAPFHTTLLVRLSNPAKVRPRLDDLRRSFGNSAFFEGMHLSGDLLRISSAPRRDVDGWSDLQRDVHFKRTMAHLPEDRFATLYVNAPELRRISDAYERYLQNGEEVGSVLLEAVTGLVGDPATRSLLDQLQNEGASEQHLGTAATFRLGILQGHTHTDWQPQDPEGLKARSEALIRASSARSWQLLDAAP